MHSILIVEDDMNINGLLKEALRKRTISAHRHFQEQRRVCFLQ